jgi:hypothetical protein
VAAAEAQSGGREPWHETGAGSRSWSGGGAGAGSGVGGGVERGVGGGNARAGSVSGHTESSNAFLRRARGKAQGLLGITLSGQ